jgi:hypothetical protein
MLLPPTAAVPPPPCSRMRDISDRGDAWQSTPLPVRARCARKVATAAAAEEAGEETAARRGGGGRGSAPGALAPAPPLTQLSIAGNTHRRIRSLVLRRRHAYL